MLKNNIINSIDNSEFYIIIFNKILEIKKSTHDSKYSCPDTKSKNLKEVLM